MKNLFLFFSFCLLFVHMNLIAQVTVSGAHSSSNGSYSKLKLAFDAINGQNQSGNNIIIAITANTTETATASLTGAGGMWNTLLIYPSVSERTISGNLAAPLIDLNGAKNVTIDGRVNQAGNKSLIISNTNSTTTAGTSTIRFINSAENNIIQFCTLKGSTCNASSGVIFFSNSTSGNGNDNNVIDNCDITNAGTRPINCVFSLGTNTYNNSGNVIINNNFYNHHKTDASSYGIKIDDFSIFTISVNSFYETTSLQFSTDVSVIPIWFGSQNGYVNIFENYIGGKAAQCGGTAFTITDNGTARSIYYKAISLEQTDIYTGSNIQNNIVRNIEIVRTTSDIPFTGININSLSYVENVTGNIIGADTGTGSIKVTFASTGYSICNSYGFSLYVTVCKINNNKIGSITINATPATESHYFYCLRVFGGSSGNTYIENNLIGSLTEANSIISNTVHTGNGQILIGICPECTSVNEKFFIRSNIIANLTNNTNSDYEWDQTIGIYINYLSPTYYGQGEYEISSNTIRDIKSASANASSGYKASLMGIFMSTFSLSHKIFCNTIYNLENTYTSSAGVNVKGIDFKIPVNSGTSNIYSNFVHSLKINSSNTSASASITGIEIDNGDGSSGNSKICNVYNNSIYIGNSINNNCILYGIYEWNLLPSTNNFYYNTVYLTGSPNGNTNTKALYINASSSSNVRNILNNIFINARSRTGGTGKHYAAYFGNTTGVTINYNDYVASGTGAMLAYWVADRSTIAALRTANGQDANSLNTNPSFSNAGGTNAIDYITSTTLSGTAITGFTTDYLFVTRNATPTMGAFERAYSQYAVWTGTTSTDFNTASNWESGAVPATDASIIFKSTASNNCILDQNRSIATLVNTTSRNFVLNGYQLTIKGSINQTSTGKIDASITSTVVFNGSSAQTIPSEAFVNNQVGKLTIYNSSGVILGGDLTVRGTFYLRSGKLTLGDNNLTYSGTNAISGTPSSSNMIVATGSGELRKTFTTTGSFTFPVGDNDGIAKYTPVTLNFTSGTFSSAYVGVNLKNYKHPNNSSPTNYLSRYWSVTQSGITGFTYDITLKYIYYIDVVGTEEDIKFGKYNGSVWTYLGTVDTAEHQLEASGLTSFSTFSGGRDNAMPVVLSSFLANVNKRNVSLKWITTEEVNNQGFDIYRLFSEKNEWEKIGFVKGNGSTNEQKNYVFEDKGLSTGKYQYRLKQIDNNGNFEYHNLNGTVEIGVPLKFELCQNYPNPFNPATKINFDLPQDSKVSLIVYDVTGKEIKKLVNEVKTAGFHTVTFNASNFSSGIYFYRIIANSNGKDFICTKKMVLLK